MWYGIKINLEELGCEGVDWILVAQNKDQWQAPREEG
jgi:hypothetical protein